MTLVTPAKLAVNNQVGYSIQVEKRKPHCPLTTVKSLIEQKRVRSTFSAIAGGAALGLDFDGMLEVVVKLTHADFYKSMTTHFDNKVWQDVYRPVTAAGAIYLKLTVVDDLLVVSFKVL